MILRKRSETGSSRLNLVRENIKQLINNDPQNWKLEDKEEDVSSC